MCRATLVIETFWVCNWRKYEFVVCSFFHIIVRTSDTSWLGFSSDNGERLAWHWSIQMLFYIFVTIMLKVVKEIEIWVSFCDKGGRQILSIQHMRNILLPYTVEGQVSRTDERYLFLLCSRPYFYTLFELCNNYDLVKHYEKNGCFRWQL